MTRQRFERLITSTSDRRSMRGKPVKYRYATTPLSPVVIEHRDAEQLIGEV
jgi:hypothetical protein